jgi:hypothetical protein
LRGFPGFDERVSRVEGLRWEGAGGPYEDDTDSGGEFEDRITEQCARMHGPSPLVGGFWGLERVVRVTTA